MIEANGPYAGTDFNGVEFVYTVIPNLIPAQCRKRVEALKDDSEKITETTLNGVAYDHFSYVEAEAGHQAFGEVYATASHGHCYLFEEAIHLKHAGYKASERGPEKSATRPTGSGDAKRKN